MARFDDEEEKREKLESRINQFRSHERKQDDSDAWKGVYLVFSFGFVVAACVLLGLWIGITLDHRWNTEPWLTLAGVFVGFCAAALSGYNLIRPLIGKK